MVSACETRVSTMTHRYRHRQVDRVMMTVFYASPEGTGFYGSNDPTNRAVWDKVRDCII